MSHSGPHPGWQERTIQLLGEEKFRRLQDANVLVAGMGGVGSMAAEMICRGGVGKMTIVDGDRIQPGNINRQIPATHSSLNRDKAVVMGERLKDINPGLELTVINEFIKDDRIPEILREPFDYVVDAIDTLSPKIYLIYHAVKKGLKNLIDRFFPAVKYMDKEYQNRITAYKATLLAMIADGKLTKKENQAIDVLRDHLEITEKEHHKLMKEIKSKSFNSSI